MPSSAGQHADAVIRITVPRPGAPVAADDAYTTPYATPRTVDAPGILGNDSGTGIAVTDHGSPSHGSVAVQADGSLVYTPVSGFAGVDDLTYEITDETGQTTTATVTISVDPPDAPIAADDAYATPYETSLVVPANGVMGNDASADDESFSDGLLEYPHYTRPASFRGWEVPEVLRSGDHGKVARWRRAQALARTRRDRPDLLEQRGGLTDDELRLLAEFDL